MDGTFKVCPPNFHQVYTIHGSMFGNSHPLVYKIMKNKNISSYNKIFSFINYENSINPEYNIFDFEKTAINACKMHFFN
jgi:hypothetical protein